MVRKCIENNKLALLKNAMVSYTTTILKFDKQGEKTGWTYIVIPADVAQSIHPGIKKIISCKREIG